MSVDLHLHPPCIGADFQLVALPQVGVAAPIAGDKLAIQRGRNRGAGKAQFAQRVLDGAGAHLMRFGVYGDVHHVSPVSGAPPPAAPRRGPAEIRGGRAH